MFCRNCGKETTINSEYCTSCGARPLTGTAYCPACANPTTPLSEICVKCGAKLLAGSPAAVTVNRSKSKVASILLAIFLGFWTWLYTYKNDGWKFWIGLGISLVGVVIGAVVFGVNIASDINNYDIESEFGSAFLVQWIVFWLGASLIGTAIWIWGIVDTAIKKDEWYNNYPDTK